MVSDCENVTMLISAVINILACDLGIFSLKIGEILGFFAFGMVPFTGTSYVRKTNADVFCLSFMYMQIM
jgi:1,4-dihydroxy-2-naphthoate octaprenyltransferase